MDPVLLSGPRAALRRRAPTLSRPLTAGGGGGGGGGGEAGPVLRAHEGGPAQVCRPWRGWWVLGAAAGRVAGPCQPCWPRLTEWRAAAGPSRLSRRAGRTDAPVAHAQEPPALPLPRRGEAAAAALDEREPQPRPQLPAKNRRSESSIRVVDPSRSESSIRAAGLLATVPVASRPLPC